jgi:hypothetical protein
MNKTLTDMREILKGFANAMNLLNPDVPKNHQRVAYLSYNLAAEMGYKEEDRIQLIRWIHERYNDFLGIR